MPFAESNLDGTNKGEIYGNITSAERKNDLNKVTPIITGNLQNFCEKLNQYNSNKCYFGITGDVFEILLKSS